MAGQISDIDALRTVYRPPTAAVANKAVPTVDPTSARFVAAAPFFVLATTDGNGTDASPRGGPPGFVKVLEGGTRLAFADLNGNNRLDSYENLLHDPQVGLIFLVPGSDETVRVNGAATLSTEPDILAATAIDGRTPKVAVVVDVHECFIHCAKAVRRAALWDTSTWPSESTEVPTAGEIINDQHALGADPADITAGLEANYRDTMWELGGE